MAYATVFFLSILVLYVIPCFCSVQKDRIHSAAEILANTGFTSMALTFQVASEALISDASTVTIFAPSDQAFLRVGQPLVSILRYQVSPVFYSFDQLRSMRFGSSIPTLSGGRSLVVTTRSSEDHVSINNIKIHESAIYDDGILIVFAIDDFFDPNFQIQSPGVSPSSEFARHSPAASPNLECPVYAGGRLFKEAVRKLRSNGFSIMASFLELQLVQIDDDDAHFTVFAPLDGDLQERIGGFNGWGSLFLRHVVPCEISKFDLTGLEHGSALSTLLEGYSINITRSDDHLLLNGVPVAFPDVFHGDRLTVHGIPNVFSMPTSSVDQGVNSPSEGGEEVIIDEF